MFNAEPQEAWSKEEAAEFEAHVAARHKKTIRSAAWAGMALLADFLCFIPFSGGHALNRYFVPFGQIFLFAAFALFVWFVLKVGLVWASWQSARETRREFGDPT
jgi:hypothetical protein